ncbi:hypothetical protein Tco_0487455 [Tanacetum coccineum]
MSYRHQDLTSPEQMATALASPKQMAIGKDYSNPLMAGSLPKTILCVNLTAEASTDTDGEVTITAIIDGQSKTITEASLSRHLKLEDHDEYHVSSPNESPLYVVPSHRSDEGSLKLNELTNLVTKLSERIGVLKDDLKKTKQTYNSAFTKLILRIKKLESKVKTGKARKRARVVLLEDEEDDSSKQGRIDEDRNTYFHQDDEVDIDAVHDTAEERQPEDSTASIIVSTTPINISTARETRSTARRVVYGKRSKEARKDKGKASMTEPEPEKKSKKLLEQERLGLEEAIRLQEQVDEEERAQVARDEEIARQLLALDEERATSEPKTTKDIDWNDPSVQKYWDLKNKPKSKAQARKNMIVYLKNQNLEIEKEKKKPAEFQEIEIEQIEKYTIGKRKKSLPIKRTRSSIKKQKVELYNEKEDLKGYLDIVPREDVVVNVDSLSIKYPIVDWKTYTLSENFMYYKIIRGDGSSKNYKILSKMLYDFDRQDVVELYRLVKESSHFADAKWNCHTYAYRKEVSSKLRNDIKDADAPITTVGVSVSTAEPSAPPTTTTFIEDKDLIIAHTLMKIRSEKSKEKVKERGSKENSSEPATRPTRGVTMQEPSESGIRKAGNTQAMMEADYELAQRLQAKEQGELTIKERSRLFVELMDKRKKHFAKLRMLYDKEMKRVNSLVLMDSKVVEGSEKKMESSRKETVSKKRAGEELDEESVKRKKLEDDAKKAELQLCLEIVPRDDEVVNVESLSNKYLIVDWKTHILAEDKMYY